MVGCIIEPIVNVDGLIVNYYFDKKVNNYSVIVSFGFVINYIRVREMNDQTGRITVYYCFQSSVDSKNRL